MVMASAQPHIRTPGDPAPSDGPPGPGGVARIPDGPPGPSGMAAVLPVVGFVSLVLLVVVALAPIGGWVGFAIALALLALGIVGAVRYVLRLASSGDSPVLGQGRTADTSAESSPSEDARELEPSDLPLGAPARREVVRRGPRPGWQRRRGETRREPPRRQRIAR